MTQRLTPGSIKVSAGYATSPAARVARMRPWTGPIWEGMCSLAKLCRTSPPPGRMANHHAARFATLIIHKTLISRRKIFLKTPIIKPRLGVGGFIVVMQVHTQAVIGGSVKVIPAQFMYAIVKTQPRSPTNCPRSPYNAACAGESPISIQYPQLPGSVNARRGIF